MNLSHRVRLWVFVCLVGAASTAAAQTTPSPTAPPPIAHVSALDGAASLDRDGITETLTPGWPILSGDRIRTDSGRVEVLFTDGSALHLDESTTADILAADLLRLLAGRVYSYAAGMRDPSRAVRYQIDAPAASVQINWPGQYRLAAVDGRLELAVVSGEAVLATDAGSVTVRAGEQAFANDGQRPFGAVLLQLRPLGHVRPLERLAPRRTCRHRLRPVPACGPAAVFGHVRSVRHVARRTVGRPGLYPSRRR